MSNVRPDPLLSPSFEDTVETLQEFKQEVKEATTLDKDDLPTEEDLKLPDQDNNK